MLATIAENRHYVLSGPRVSTVGWTLDVIAQRHGPGTDMAIKAPKNRQLNAAEYHKQSRAIAALLGEIERSQDANQTRVIASFLEAILSTSSRRSKVSVSDLDQLDEVQFENIILSLRYARNTRLTWRAKKRRSAH
jgi:hypothetical protein